MSWTGTYTYWLLRAGDVAIATDTAEIPDITVSSLCYVVQMADANVGDPEFAPVTPGTVPWSERLASLQLKTWELKFLRWLGPKLDQVDPGHRKAAAAGDLEKARRIVELLG